ncbi:hypothetical protein UFOVP777_32 [uncultured Caudovirales phage]|uniref:Uncharacterized protein n=1 Tax=uncultured Caudovirales phage TaxID=2100421 RepID=A0A6J5P452_9CAUD|nr:hypothetical protein UFOVP777_32 [uncultured Caudovirales phage]
MTTCSTFVKDGDEPAKVFSPDDVTDHHAEQLRQLGHSKHTDAMSAAILEIQFNLGRVMGKLELIESMMKDTISAVKRSNAEAAEYEARITAKYPEVK